MIKSNDRAFAGRDIRLVGPDGEQVGIVKFEKGVEMAKASGLDVVMVSENSEPPVCRIMDFGKLRYEQKKKIKDQKKHSVAQKVKEIKLRVGIDTHDYGYKTEHAHEFLEKNHKLKITLAFRGREMAHKDMGFQLIEKVIEDLKDVGIPDGTPKLIGRNLCISFSPKGK